MERTSEGISMRVAAILGLANLIGLSCPAWAVDKVTFGTNWLADPEAGGYYQALVDGTYAKYGLDVTILPGGPMSNGGLLLISGKIEFYMGGDMLGDFFSVEQNFPVITVAAHFQKDPQVLMSHPGVGLDKFADLKNATAIVSKGYVTSEPFEVEKQGGFKPNVFLLADYGYSSYATTIVTRREIVAKNPDLVQRFVDASTIGWYHYLYGDNAKANEAIKHDNPEMTDEQIVYTIGKLKEYGIVDSGDTLTKGIGAMTDAKVKDFFDKMVAAGVVKPTIDYKKAFTLQFVNKGVGLELRPK
jgi:NitT/TauT family transport system substrate-binding protein